MTYNTRSSSVALSSNTPDNSTASTNGAVPPSNGPSSTSGLPSSAALPASPPTHDILASVQAAIASSLGPLDNRLQQIEHQLSSASPLTRSDNLNPSLQQPSPDDIAAPTRQLQNELEGGNPMPSASSVFERLGQQGFPTNWEGRASGMDTSKMVGQWFSGVKSEHVQAILRNDFIPTDLIKLLSHGKSTGKGKSMELQLGSIGTVALNPLEADAEDYAMWSFFQAWEIYRGIFIWGAPSSSRGLLASALSAHTNTLFRLTRSYSWPAARAYHFAFHQLRLDDSITVYDPNAWRKVDSDLVSEHCLTSFASTSSQPKTRVNYRSQPYPSPSNSVAIPMSERVRFPQATSPRVTGQRRQNLPVTRAFPGLCDFYNLRSGCRRDPCPWTHGCNRCGRLDHAAFQCSAPHST
ncbi:hypothetical protein BJ508DRAFT_309744 [Ascobolus immersus RN42]|uniref:Uncharacterized protein n=1 Tax=Ascobolus immersus RN42 TaxID=1160509 RepID=A0A3N4HW63_ASCIM|nr:hypothetical protein BJ508DRAFT_309744 [Ascobolus immersus RN42]